MSLFDLEVSVRRRLFFRNLRLFLWNLRLFVGNLRIFSVRGSSVSVGSGSAVSMDSDVDSSSGTSGPVVSVDSVVSNVPVLVWALTTPSATVVSAVVVSTLASDRRFRGS